LKVESIGKYLGDFKNYLSFENISILKEIIYDEILTWFRVALDESHKYWNYSNKI